MEIFNTMLFGDLTDTQVHCKYQFLSLVSGINVRSSTLLIQYVNVSSVFFILDARLKGSVNKVRLHGNKQICRLFNKSQGKERLQPF